MAQHLILCGSQRSDREKRTHKILQDGYPSALLIVPTRQYAKKRGIELLNGLSFSAIYKDVVSDFTQFAFNLLEGQHLPLRLLEGWEQILLIRALILSDTGKSKFKQYEGLIAPEDLARSFHRIIHNLKQAGVTPETFEEKIKKQSVQPWDEIVCWLYSTYQEQLLKHNWYDIPGLFWQAEIECQQGKPAYIEGKKILIFDGFDDFTYSELRLIKALSPYFEKIIVGLNLDPFPSRQDIYRLAKEALKQLQSLLDAETVFLDTPPPETSVEFIADTLFWRDEPQIFAPSITSTIEVNHYINREEEIKHIGRKIKQLLVQECVPPQKIAVTYRQMNTVRPLIEKIFTDYGIPYRMASLQSLRETGVGRFIERWLTQMTEDSFNAITLLLHDPLWNIPVPIREKFFLLLQTVGFSSHMPVEFIAQKIEENKNNLEGDILQLYGELKRWFFWRNKFLKQDDVDNYSSLLIDLLDSLENSLQKYLSNESNKGNIEREKKAYFQFISIFKKLNIFLGNLKLSLEEFQRLVLSLLSEIPIFDTGHCLGVMCLDLPMIRNMKYDYLFVGGVEEGTIPLSSSLNVVYSDKDITTLRQLGLPIDDVAKQIQREWLFFQQIFETAQKGVFLSHVVYSETHEEHSPSLLLRELQEVFQYVQDCGLQTHQKPTEKPFIPCSPAELRNLLFYYQTGDVNLKQQYSDIYEGWYSLQKREKGEGNIYTGYLQSEDIQEWLVHKLGYNHVYSVDQIEEYVECPFRFWAHRVLNLEDWEEELVYPSPLMLGSWAHDVLYILLKEHFEELQKDKSFVINEKLKQVITDIVCKDRRTFVFRKKLVDVIIEWLTRVLRDFLCSNTALIEMDWKPSYFEIAFGKTLSQMRDEKSQNEPYAMKIQDKTVLFSGRIDRIDRHVNNPSLRIIDYKWGKTPTPTDMGVEKKQLKDKIRSFQLIIYELAVEEHLFKEENFFVEESSFLSITEQEKKPAPWVGNKNMRGEIEKIVINAIHETLHNIHQGKFNPVPYTRQSCDYCFCKNACRYTKSVEGNMMGDGESGEIETA